jgi:aspartate racemase
MSPRPHPTIGIIGGFGPMTSARFCCSVVKQAHALKSNCSPAFMMDSVAIPHATATAFIRGSVEAGMEHARAIHRASQRLALAGVRTIAIPCNTVHLFEDHFDLPTGVSLLHIIDATLRQLQEQRCVRMGLLATTMTVRSGVYQRRCEAAGIECVIPPPRLQRDLSNLIAEFVRSGTVTPQVVDLFMAVNDHFSRHGAEVIVLGCTDIGGMLSQAEITHAIPVLDSLELLAKEVALASLL